MRNLTAKSLNVILTTKSGTTFNLSHLITGNITIGFSAIAPGALTKSTRLSLHAKGINPLTDQRFIEGNKIELFHQGTKVDTLRILKRAFDNGNTNPGEPPTSPELTLILGCKLALFNIYSTPSDIPNNNWNGPIRLKAYLRKWLDWANCDAAIADDPNVLVGSYFAYTNGELANFLGKVAYGTGLHYLWCDRDENFRLSKLPLDGSSVRHLAASELAIYKSSPVESEKPPGTIVITGLTQWMKGRINPLPITINESRGNVTITEVVNTVYSDAETRTTRTGRASSTGVDIGGIANSSRNYEVTRVLSFTGPNRALVSDTTETRIQIQGGGVNIGLTLSKRETETYTYQGITINTIRKVTELIPDSDLAIGSNSLVTDQIRTQTWTYDSSSDRYHYSGTLVRPRSTDEPVTLSSPTNTDEVKPPRTTFAVPRYAPVPTPITFSKNLVGNQTDIKHRRTIPMGQFISVGFTARDMATEQAKLLWGREFPFIMAWEYSPSDIQADCQPWIAIALEQDGQVFYFLVEAITRTFGEDISHIGGSSIYLGQMIDGRLITPYEAISGGEMAHNSIITESGARLITEEGAILIWSA